MADWISVADVADDLGFPQFRDDPDLPSKEVRKIITRLHPDRTGGEFRTKKSEDRFHMAQAAEQFIAATAKNGSLVRISDLKEIVEVLSKSHALSNRENSGVLSERYLLAEKQRSLKRFFPIRLGSGVISSIIIFLIAFPKTFAENPVLANLIQSESFQITSLVALLLFGIAFLFSYVGERRLESRIDYAMSESALSELVTEISFRADHYN